MRITVLYNDRGEVLAATLPREGADQFVAGEGEHSREFELPESVPVDQLDQQLDKLWVDLPSNTLTHRDELPKT